MSRGPGPLAAGNSAGHQTIMSRDTLFKNGQITEDFCFNSKVAEVFDDMLQRSVPWYSQVIDMTTDVLRCFLLPGDRVYDLGCATGSTLLELARRLESLQLEFVGIDNSRAMLDKARAKVAGYTMKERFRFEERDINDLEFEGAGGVILNYSLQFVRPMLRQPFMKKVYSALRPGGVLIMSEKIISPDPQLNRNFIEFYLQFKRERGYSELEISRKREALENVLIPFSIDENRQLLAEAGFSGIETFFQWFNFVSFVAVKN